MSPLSCAQKPLFMGSFGPPPLMKGTYLTVSLALPWQFKGTFRAISVGYEFRIGKAKRRRYLWKRKNCQSSVKRFDTALQRQHPLVQIASFGCIIDRKRCQHQLHRCEIVRCFFGLMR